MIIRRTPITLLSIAGAGLIALVIATGKGALAEDPVIQTTNKRFELVLDAKSPPPEEPVYEVDPGERPGYVWNKGFWGWNGKRHIWQPGHWLKQRPGQVWVADTWAQRGTRWRMYPGHWEKEEPLDTTDNEEDAAPETVVAEATPEMVEAPSIRATGATKGKIPTHANKPRRPNYHDTKMWPRVKHH